MSTIELTPLYIEDADEITALLQAPEVERNLLRLPFPYIKEYAVNWLQTNSSFKQQFGKEKNYAIRQKNGQLLGVIGFHFGDGDTPERCEIGYWLGMPHWGKGIMPEAVKQICTIARDQYGLKILSADVFVRNPNSQKVLLKAGFTNTQQFSTKTKLSGEVVEYVKWERVL